MSDLPIYFISIFLLGAAAYYFFFSTEARVHRKIRTAFVPGTYIEDGERVKITGKVVSAGRVLTAPLSQKKCVYYHIRVEDNSGQRDMFKNHIDLEETRVSDIVVYDGKNYVVVDTQLLDAAVREDEQQTSGFFDFTTPELKKFLKKHGEPTENVLGWSLNLSASESVLEIGDTVTVAGRATWRESKDFKIRVPVKQVLYLEALDRNAVYLSDHPDI